MWVCVRAMMSMCMKCVFVWMLCLKCSCWAWNSIEWTAFHVGLGFRASLSLSLLVVFCPKYLNKLPLWITAQCLLFMCMSLSLFRPPYVCEWIITVIRIREFIECLGIERTKCKIIEKVANKTAKVELGGIGHRRESRKCIHIQININIRRRNIFYFIRNGTKRNFFSRNGERKFFSRKIFHPNNYTCRIHNSHCVSLTLTLSLSTLHTRILFGSDLVSRDSFSFQLVCISFFTFYHFRFAFFSLLLCCSFSFPNCSIPFTSFIYLSLNVLNYKAISKWHFQLQLSIQQ